ncbi:MAG: hypothetical protein DRR42_12450 [Gammaproteobacteria bacterium]|nr:MAG: hypothetical protein DRR42_12450 [Gammaproteobacteria bacterium]
MKFSIIVPIYNVSEYLEQCLLSVINQEYQDFEVIAINDGSTDGSAVRLRQIAERDGRIVVWDRDNKGLSATRNFGVKKAQGDYIVFLDADDALAEGALRIMHEQLTGADLDLLMYGAIARYDLVSEKVEERKYPRPQSVLNKVGTGRDAYVKLLYQNAFYPSACFFAVRRKLANAVNFYPGIYYEDSLYSLQLLFNETCLRVKIVENALYVRRIRENSITTGAVTDRHVQDNFIILGEMAAFFGTLTDVTKFEKKAFNIQRTKVLLTALKHAWEMDDHLSFGSKLLYTKTALGFYSGLKTLVIIVKILFPGLRKYLAKSKLIENTND